MDTSTRTRLTITGVVLAAAVASAAVMATTLPVIAGAASTPSADAGSGSASGGHQANGITEEPLTGDVAAEVEAAVLAEYPGATIQRMETDAEGAAYEAHIVQSDGSPATVKLDEFYNVTDLEEGGPGGRHSDRGGDAGFGSPT